MDKKFLVFVILGILGIVAVSGCTSNTNSTGNNANLGPNTVAIQNFAFNPATLNVRSGTKVTWINQDSTTHQVVSDTGVFNSWRFNQRTEF